MSASKFLNGSTLGNAGDFPFTEKLKPWPEFSVKPDDDVEWDPDTHGEFAAFLKHDFVLQRPPRAAFDRFTEVAMAEHGDDDSEGAEHLRMILRQSHRFLMTHDWAAAFAGDRDFDDRGSEFRLPAPTCCFDFYVSGAHVLALVTEEAFSADGSLAPDDGTDHFLLGVQLKNGWVLHGRSGAYDAEVRLFTFIFRHIKAACVALEAEIAETEIVRAPHKLNAARVRRGKLPLSDYHIINLMRRQRAAPLPLDHETEPHRSPRLHFRRGHWRHFVNHKTWIKWTLVGDPDLGFIDKEYRL